MELHRRTALRLAGLGVGTALAGCLDLGDGTRGTGTPTKTPVDDDAEIVDHGSTPFALRSSVPEWYHLEDDEPVGHANVVDSGSRKDELLDLYDLPAERRADVDAFLDDVDYETDRLVLVESVGPSGCHDELAIENVRLEDGRLRADATVVDTGEEATDCTAALVFPSALLRVSFDGDPVDEVGVDVTDGSEETATVTASPGDPLLAPDPGDLPGYVRPGSDPDPVAPLECGEAGVVRHDQWYDEEAVRWGDAEDAGDVVLSLRADDLEYEYGDTARFTLRNVTAESVHTGNRAKYNLQVYTEDGWQDVRVQDGEGYFEYTDEGVGHAPGDGFEWTFELTEDGVVADTYHDDARVCPDLQPGRYRFAYFGVTGDGALAVSFDLTE